MSPSTNAVGALLAVAALGVAAQQLPLRDPAADTINFQDKLPQENKIRLPPAPKSDGLIRFDAGPARRGFEHFIDGASIDVGSDGIIRYTLVIKSDLGAENVAYEGIRCVTREHKTYAHGRRDGSWRELPDRDWRKIGQAYLEGPTFVLYEDFFCPGRAAVRTASEAVAGLKNGIHPEAVIDSAERTAPLRH